MQTLLSIRQVAEETGREPASIRYLIKKGRLKTVRVGWVILIPRAELKNIPERVDASQG